MRHERTNNDDETPILYARTITINDDIVLLDGVEFPGRLGDDTIIQFTGVAAEILDMGGNLLATVIQDDGADGVDDLFAGIVGGIHE